MRNYLYIWHDPAQQMIVASGMEFQDFLPALGEAGGIVLRKGGAGTARKPARYQLVAQQQLPALAREDLYACGSHAWADYRGAAPPASGDADVARALAHHAAAAQRTGLTALRNRFLAFAHDDGWYLKLFYAAWDDAAQLLAGAVPATLGPLDVPALRRGDAGYWLRQGAVHAEVQTHDIDSVLNRRL